jgi:CheY-like chemotaxis protein
MADAGEKPRILVVEDHPLIAELVETRLRIEGMSPVTCPNGIEALEVLGREPLDAVILDVMIASGRRLRGTPTHPFQPSDGRPARDHAHGQVDARRHREGPGARRQLLHHQAFSGLDLVRKLRSCLEGRMPQRSERTPPPAQ